MPIRYDWLQEERMGQRRGLKDERIQRQREIIGRE